MRVHARTYVCVCTRLCCRYRSGSSTPCSSVRVRGSTDEGMHLAALLQHLTFGGFGSRHTAPRDPTRTHAFAPAGCPAPARAQHRATHTLASARAGAGPPCCDPAASAPASCPAPARARCSAGRARGARHGPARMGRAEQKRAPVCVW